MTTPHRALKLALWVAFVVLHLPAPAEAQAPSSSRAEADSLAAPEKNFTRAALEVTGVNVGVWLYCRYIREGGTNTGFRIGIQSWKDNLLNGFEWDDNHFDTNQLAHPYHGSMYFCSARANGFDYWESTAFSFAGSAMWEYFGEVHNASINDWISTGYAGVPLGEMLHRFSGMILDNRLQGSQRTWREVGGLLVNPMGGINRMITGEWSRVGPNPPGVDPRRFSAAVRAGARFTGEQTLSNSDTTRAFFRLRGVYGDQATGECRVPFDVFSFDIQFNPGDVSPVGRAQVFGLLHSWELGRGERTASYFGLVTNYDYIYNWAYIYGGQSVGASVFTRRSWDAWRLDAGLTANWIILGGTSSDYASFTGRSYDYGPGAGGKLFVGLRRHGYNVLLLESDLYHLRIMNGTKADHLVTENRLTAGWPLFGTLGIGAEYSVYNAERRYADYPHVSARDPQLTAYLAWAF
jgi:uncharacterized protein DUF3943